MTLSALIYELDHRGISNVQLAKEFPEMAEKYDSKSLAEQHSLDFAWNVLMFEPFSDLRDCLIPPVDCYREVLYLC